MMSVPNNFFLSSNKDINWFLGYLLKKIGFWDGDRALNLFFDDKRFYQLS